MTPETWNGLEVHRFGDGPELADELLHLVLEGKKTATCWDAAEGLKGAEVGKPWAVKNSAGDIRCTSSICSPSASAAGSRCRWSSVMRHSSTTLVTMPGFVVHEPIVHTPPPLRSAMR